MTKEVTERELIELIKVRSRDGFDILYQNYSCLAYGIIYRVLGDEKEADDILQQVFMQIWKHICDDNFEKDFLSTWIINFVRSESINHKKRENKSGFEEAGDAYRKHDSPEGIDGIHREVMEIVFLQGHSYATAAKILGIPIETLKTRMRDALQILREK